MRLDKFLADCGRGSRKEIKALLKSGTVSVNGEAVRDGSVKINENEDKILVGNLPIIYKPFVYLMLNKPKDYVSAVFDKKQKVVTELVPEEYAHYEVYPVGRLDIDTEGLLILTNDGELCHRLLSPKNHVDKTYFLRCKKELTESDIQKAKDGIVLDDGYVCMSADLKITDNPTEAYLTIREGKFHQVKRMMESLENKVVYLKRISMGGLVLDEALGIGEIRELTEEEEKLLSQKTNNATK